MDPFVLVRRDAHNAPASPLRLVRPATPPPFDPLAKLRRAFDALAARKNNGTRRLARAALLEVGEIVAGIGLHLPLGTKRRRAFQRETIDPILAAISAATGHCDRCGIRVASWAVPTGYPLAFVPCRSHKAAGGAS